jgi:hypothetical protein
MNQRGDEKERSDKDSEIYLLCCIDDDNDDDDDDVLMLSFSVTLVENNSFPRYVMHAIAFFFIILSLCSKFTH